MTRLHALFEDQRLVEKVQRKLPNLFQMAEIESSRAGKVGMEVGSLRERILIALLIYKFGPDAVETKIPITKSQVDVRLFGEAISIKTITGLSGVKAVWTVDAESARLFSKKYKPECEILLIQVKWDCKNPRPETIPGNPRHPGGLFLIPLDAQLKLFASLGRENYLKLPKPGTNPRGVEFSRETVMRLIQDPNSRCIPILWRKTKVDYDPYKRWVDYWSAD
ncbi:MAG: type II restriction endonuclease subunit R [Candidatus Verstraetearchaeota archaeon]|nr:type II restriction endonuclease subunit R [Candidatus Verstraetearchaeota archaeon]